MQKPSFGRRAFLSSGVISAFGAATLGSSKQVSAGPTDQPFSFEITRTDAEWRARLTEDEFKILRRGSTELPNTSPFAKETAEGIYCCKGCDLTLYQSIWKVPLHLGWAFFHHSEPRAVLTSIDGDPPSGMGDERDTAMLEVHCRRCGSHLGHIVHVQNQLVHCINGTALTFVRARA